MMVPILACISLGVVVVIYIIQLVLKRRNRNYLYSLLPGPKFQHPILGDLPVLVGRSKSDGINFHVSLLQSLLGLSHIFRKDGLYRIWFANDPYVVLFDADALEPIMSSQTSIEKAHVYNSLQRWLKTGLLTSTGNKWKERRKLLTPTFHYRILDEFVPIFDQHSKQFAEKLSSFVETDCIDIVPLISVFTLEIICETAMGIKTGSDKDKFAEYVNAVTVFGDILMKKFAQPWLQNDFIFSYTSDYLKEKKILETLHQFTSKVVKQRKRDVLDKIGKFGTQEADNNLGIRRKQALLDLLLESQFKGSMLSDEDICEEVNTFMFAGHDTTSAGIYWALYHLGRHPEIQEKVYQEIREVFGNDRDREATLKDVNELKYLERVVKESQRITPSVPMISRLASEDFNLKGYTIPRGTSMLMLILSLHHDPSVFPNPELFDPDRFLSENTADRHPFSFVPFSAGSRNCIGQRFAMLEMKVILCNIVRNFVFESLDPPDRILSTALMILKPSDGLKMKIRKRDCTI